MDLERITGILELPGVPAFAFAEGRVLCAVNGAEALGFLPGAELSRLLPDLTPPEPGARPETRFSLDGSSWILRAAAEPDCTLCFLRPEPAAPAAPNENTLLHAAGSIRLALHDVSVALEGLTDPAAPEDLSRCGGLGLRGVYRLRRAAEAMELYAKLRSGSYRLACREISVNAAASAFFGELAELLRSADLELRWELPPRDFILPLDWPLITVLLQGLIANAASDPADGLIRVKLTRIEDRRLLFTVSNRPAEPLPEGLFHLHADPQQALSSGMGLGLSLISAGAACHGGNLLLSAGEDGSVSALLSLTAGSEAEQANRSFIQLPTGEEANLVALSPVLPPELYRPEALL